MVKIKPGSHIHYMPLIRKKKTIVSKMRTNRRKMVKPELITSSIIATRKNGKTKDNKRALFTASKRAYKIDHLEGWKFVDNTHMWKRYFTIGVIWTKGKKTFEPLEMLLEDQPEMVREFATSITKDCLRSTGFYMGTIIETFQEICGVSHEKRFVPGLL
jgi:hypothetical protein